MIASCRSRRELSNEYLVATIGFDTAENEPCGVCPLSVYGLFLLPVLQILLLLQILIDVFITSNTIIITDPQGDGHDDHGDDHECRGRDNHADDHVRSIRGCNRERRAPTASE